MGDATHLASSLSGRRWPRRPSPAEEHDVLGVLHSGRWTDGAWTRLVEERLSEVTGARHAVAFNSCTSALHATLDAYGAGRGATVGAAAFGFLGTLTGAAHLRASLVLEDPDPDTLNLASRPAADVVLAVDLHGVPHGLDRRHVITDACQSLGSRIHGAPVGSQGTHCWSFSSAKMVAAPDGGAVTTDDSGLAEILRTLRNYGLATGSARASGQAVRLGHNWRPSEVTMAMVWHRLASLGAWTARTRAVTARLHEAADRAGLWRQRDLKGGAAAWHKVRVAPAGLDCDASARLEAALHRAGVPTHRWGSVPLHRQWAYGHCGPLGSRPVAEAVAAGSFCLGTENNPPMTWTDDEVAQVCDALLTCTEAST